MNDHIRQNLKQILTFLDTKHLKMNPNDTENLEETSNI